VTISNYTDPLCFTELPEVDNGCPPSNDECINPIILTASQNLDCNNPVKGTTIAATASSESESCPGTFNDDVWFQFTAIAPVHEIQIENIVGSIPDLTFDLYEGACASLNSIFCHDEPNHLKTINAKMQSQ